MLKKIIFFSILFIQVTDKVLAQKKPLTDDTYKDWPILQNPGITNDGKYTKYSVFVPDKGESLTAEATDLSWKMELPLISEGKFTADNRRLIFINSEDSLGMLELGTNHLQYIAEVADYKIPEEGDGSYLVYKRKNVENEWMLLDLNTGVGNSYQNMETCLFDPTGRSLLVLEKKSKDSISLEDVFLLNLADYKIKKICNSCKASGFTFDKDGKRLAFLVKTRFEGQDAFCLKYYQENLDSAVTVAGPTFGHMERMSISDDGIYFSKRGKMLFFKIQKLNSARDSTPKSTGSHVFIQGLHDTELKDQSAAGPYLAVVHLNTLGDGVIRLQQEADKARETYTADDGEWVVTESNISGDPGGVKWNMSVRPDVYLVSVKDGSRRLLGSRLLYYNMSFSPSGKYVMWFDREQRQWVCHNIILNRTRIITNRIREPLYFADDHPDLPVAPDKAAWMKNDASVLLYDRYDIWRVDPEDIKPPVNITHGYGAAHKIEFRYIDFRSELPSEIGLHDTLLLSAFNQITKQDGFFRMNMANGHLDKMIMSSHLYNYSSNDFFPGVYFPGTVMKAKCADKYILSRMSASEYPNLFFTTNFNDFKQLSDLSPQKEFNWYTTELIHWKLPDGKVGEGILCKPEDFKQNKKYPVIFYYYEKNADKLNLFINPELSKGTVNIPWFVSNGYLVFVPDIYYKIGYPGKSALNSVVSAALYLSKKPWVDQKRMGLQGHSYGGFETNYIISHTNLFSAAATASAVSNLTNIYGDGAYGPGYYESRQGRIGATLWERPDLYIENSAVFKADKVSTPVLIMHTKDDRIVPYSQGLQWYILLHRLGKKVWLLTYNGEYHTLSNPKNQMDYSIRLSQFFDHYLKGAPAPKWMTDGVLPHSDDTGLEPDTTGKQP